MHVRIHAHKDAYITRLRRIEVQIRGPQRMVEDCQAPRVDIVDLSIAVGPGTPTKATRTVAD
jgi:DNA-binding FrmR family transcriptional regulator